MTKSNGLGTSLIVDGTNLGNDVGAVSRISNPVAQFDKTGLDKSAFERIDGLVDGFIDYAPHFNPAALAAHAVLSALPTTDYVTSFPLNVTTVGAKVASVLGKQINYDAERSADGDLTFGVNKQSNGYPLEWGESYTAGIVTSTGAENLASVDDAASTAFGLSAYLHVLAFTGTSVTVTIEESSDDGSGDAFAPVVGGAFAAASAIGSQRINTAAGLTVERYLRLALSGTYSDADLLVSIVRYATVARQY